MFQNQKYQTKFKKWSNLIFLQIPFFFPFLLKQTLNFRTVDRKQKCESQNKSQERVRGVWRPFYIIQAHESSHEWTDPLENCFSSLICVHK